MVQDGAAATFEVLAQGEDAVVPGGQPGKGGLALEERGTGKIQAVEVQDVEKIVAEAVAAAGAELRLQLVEARRAAFRFYDDLAVEERRDRRQSLQCLLQRGELGGPI